jgi:hypothetical protein
MTFQVVAGFRFDDHGHVRQPGIVEEPCEGVEADLPLTDVGVAVAAGVEGAQRVVEVHAPQGVPADPLPDLGEHLRVAGRLVEGVAGGEGVAGVEADPHPVRRGDLGADGRQVLQAMPQAGALPRGVLQQHADRGSGEAREHGVERRRHPFDAGLLARPQVRAGVEHRSQRVSSSASAARERASRTGSALQRLIR